VASTFETLLLAQYSNLLSSVPQLLSSTTLTGTTASVSYTVVTAFPRILVFWGGSCSASAAAEQLYLQFNADSAAHYLWSVNQNNNATVSGTTGGSLVDQIQIGTITAGTATADYWSSGSFIVEGANQTTHFPTAVGTGTAYTSSTSNYVGVYGGQYVQATPITKVTLLPASGSFNAGSSFSFYGAN
jgi:hypothetical protein